MTLPQMAQVYASCVRQLLTWSLNLVVMPRCAASAHKEPRNVLPARYSLQDYHFLCCSSGNCIPGSSSYSVLMDTWTDFLHPLVCTQASFSGYLYIWLAYSSFQLMHVSCNHNAVRVEQAMVARRKTKRYYGTHFCLRGELWHISASA